MITGWLLMITIDYLWLLDTDIYRKLEQVPVIHEPGWDQIPSTRINFFKPNFCTAVNCIGKPNILITNTVAIFSCVNSPMLFWVRNKLLLCALMDIVISIWPCSGAQTQAKCNYRQLILALWWACVSRKLTLIYMRIRSDNCFLVQPWSTQP